MTTETERGRQRSCVGQPTRIPRSVHLIQSSKSCTRRIVQESSHTITSANVCPQQPTINSSPLSLNTLESSNSFSSSKSSINRNSLFSTTNCYKKCRADSCVCKDQPSSACCPRLLDYHKLESSTALVDTCQIDSLDAVNKYIKLNDSVQSATADSSPLDTDMLHKSPLPKSNPAQSKPHSHHSYTYRNLSVATARTDRPETDHLCTFTVEMEDAAMNKIKRSGSQTNVRRSIFFQGPDSHGVDEDDEQFVYKGIPGPNSCGHSRTISQFNRIKTKHLAEWDSIPSSHSAVHTHGSSHPSHCPDLREKSSAMPSSLTQLRALGYHHPKVSRSSVGDSFPSTDPLLTLTPSSDTTLVSDFDEQTPLFNYYQHYQLSRIATAQQLEKLDRKQMRKRILIFSILISIFIATSILAFCIQPLVIPQARRIQNIVAKPDLFQFDMLISASNFNIVPIDVFKVDLDVYASASKFYYCPAISYNCVTNLDN
ncbi:hypothetical protein RTP6_006589 [Batrachochytrium dendrobatidis]